MPPVARHQPARRQTSPTTSYTYVSHPKTLPRLCRLDKIYIRSISALKYQAHDVCNSKIRTYSEPHSRFGHKLTLINKKESLAGLAQVSGTGMEVLQNSQKFQVLWHGRTELTEVPGRYKMMFPYPGYCGHGRTELTERASEVPGTGMNAIRNFQKFFVHWVRVKPRGVWFCMYPTYVQNTFVESFLLLWWVFTLLRPPFLQGTVVLF